MKIMVVKIEYGCDIDILHEDYYKNTELDVACQYGYFRCVELLLEYGANIESNEVRDSILLNICIEIILFLRFLVKQNYFDCVIEIIFLFMSIMNSFMSLVFKLYALLTILSGCNVSTIKLLTIILSCSINSILYKCSLL